MPVNYSTNHSLVLACFVAISFALADSSVEAGENGMAEFLTIISKAYCDKCVEGFQSKTDDGFSRWKNEEGLGYRELFTTGDVGNALDYISKSECSALSEDTLITELSCDALIWKFKAFKDAPDPKFSSSKATWDHFIESLNYGNREEVLSCFLYSIRAKYETLFNSLTDSAMKEMAVKMKDIGFGQIIDNYQEAMVKNEKNKAGIVLFVNYRGEWKISQL